MRKITSRGTENAPPSFSSSDAQMAEKVVTSSGRMVEVEASGRGAEEGLWCMGARRGGETWRKAQGGEETVTTGNGRGKGLEVQKLDLCVMAETRRIVREALKA